MSERHTSEQSAIWQRRLASQADNRAWTLSEFSSRTLDEDEEMLQASHTAMYLWRIVGDVKNRAHAAQLLAHVYALLGIGNPAKHYLAKSQSVFFGDGAEPWETAMAHAVAANVAAATGDQSAHATHYAEASRLIAALPDPENRNILSATLRVIPVPLERSRGSAG